MCLHANFHPVVPLGLAMGEKLHQIVTEEVQFLDVLTLYNPLQSISEAEFTAYFNQLGRDRVILGDFNGHHPLWEPGKASDATGRHLVDALLLDPSLTILTPEHLQTYYDVRNNTFSTLDLTLISSRLASLSTVFTAPDIGSDHYPVVIRVGVAPCTVRHAVRPRWKFESDDWHIFQRCLASLPPAPVLPLQESVSCITAAIITASSQSFVQTKAFISPVTTNRGGMLNALVSWHSSIAQRSS